jgi:Fe-S-cluster containining protein
MTKLYDCFKCPGYCCSYPVIVVSRFDLARIARHFKITAEEAERRFTTSKHGYRRIMRRKADPHFGRTCRFFDTEARRCTIYEARPRVCRSFPGEGRCGYYDFLRFERKGQKDPEYISTTWHHED